jgi:hypothetical protein
LGEQKNSVLRKMAYLARVDSLAREGVVVGSHLGGLSATDVWWWTGEIVGGGLSRMSVGDALKFRGIGSMCAK